MSNEKELQNNYISKSFKKVAIFTLLSIAIGLAFYKLPTIIAEKAYYIYKRKHISK